MTERARTIATADLRSNYGELGIYAGPKNHREYWGRDGFLASLGACELGDFAPVRAHLELFRTTQAPDGQIALRVEERDHVLQFVGLAVRYDRPIARYKSSQPWAGPVVDSSALYITAGANYFDKSGDVEWRDEARDSLVRAGEWLLRRKSQRGLVEEDWVGGWADMTLKRGAVMYTNVCTWKAWQELGSLTGDKKWQREADLLKREINRQMWNEESGYYTDWLDKSGRPRGYFFADGNMLACAWGLADKKKADRIMEYVSAHGLNQMGMATCHPGMDRLNRLYIGTVFPNYHFDNVFAWWGPWEALARAEGGDRAGAKDDLARWGEIIVRNGTVPEVVDKTGKMVDLPHYKCERQIAWGAGIFVYAAALL